jgi:hypothetical protein
VSARTRGVLLGVAQLLMVASLGGVLLRDRAILPRAWVRTVSLLASTPLEGRYLQLQLVVEDREPLPLTRDSTAWVTLAADSGQVVARPAPRFRGLRARYAVVDGQRRLVLQDRLAYFIPDPAEDPRLAAAGAELWVEVSLPREGPPRALRLGVRSAGMDIIPLVPSIH